MTLQYTCEFDGILPFDAKETAERVFVCALDALGCPYEAEAELLLTDDAAVREINREQRGLDRTTDVLSFPMTDYPVPGDFSFLEDEAGAFHPETGELLLGDIVISGDKVLEQAARYGHSALREFAFLLVHSLLHLVGYDHSEPQEEKEMEEKQEQILDSMGITRE